MNEFILKLLIFKIIITNFNIVFTHKFGIKKVDDRLHKCHIVSHQNSTTGQYNDEIMVTRENATSD